MSVEPFNRLVKLAARAFYDDIPLKGENQPKNGRSDNRGMAVVILDALTRRQWVREEDLAKDLKLHTKQLRRTLRFFEEEKLVTRDHRKETAKGAQRFSAAVANTTDGHGKEGEEKIKLHTHSYCCLDYSQIYDVVRYRHHRMKKKLKDELDCRNTVQEYVCPGCKRRYNALDALQLISLTGEGFHCENCNGELVAESDKLAADEMGDGDDNARRRRREKLRDMLQKMEGQLKPLLEQLNRVKDLPCPEFGTLQAWEARASAARRAAHGDANGNDPSKSSQQYGGTPLPFMGDAKVEVDFGATAKEEDVKPDAGAMKVLPPWMIMQGMNLTKEQRGEATTEEFKVDGKPTSVDLSDDKKPKVEKEDEKDTIQSEYYKAYYAALMKRQQEQDEAAQMNQEELTSSENGFSDMPSDRQVGMKAKREDDDDVEWEDAPTTGTTTGTYKLNDLNAPVEESEEDEIDWEDG
ncbi:hypothetical protein MKW98_015662 [Papaver atlanticum]|uniref:HTH TFE/IIEalpha-type domain-containing protein n=1 Tax=Papaver atlanticum TaxID=357466 RepID=A0AAD4SJZ1_9MAGN|nr:hypothetical protein MKW98_015662 [Papaver atlanticum]